MTNFESSGYEVIVGNGPKGSGLFTVRDFACEEAIFQLDYWSQSAMPMHATNHSCNPNAAFDKDGMLRALSAIAANVEITYDYLLIPIPASPWNFACCCGSENCKGWIDGRRDPDANP